MAERTPDEVIVPARLHHVNLKTIRFEEMRAFYTKVLGIHPNAEVGTLGWYTYDYANHRLALVQFPFFSEHIANGSGMHHVAFEYDSLDDLMHTYLRLKKLDIVPATALNHGMTTSFYYLDPDGNYVELQIDNWDAEAIGSTAFMHTPEFLANPIGVPINPDSFVEAWREGATLRSLHERSWAGEFVEGAPPVFDMPANP
jgi:catechol-2,3-dioxygenase